MQYFACIYIADLAESLKITPQQLYIDYKRNVCNWIVVLTCFNYLLFKYTIGTTNCVHKLVQIFGFNSTCEFITQEGRYMLPYLLPLIIEYEPDLEPVLESIAEVALVTSSTIIINHFGTIYPHVYLNESDDIYTKVMAFISKVTALGQDNLKRRYFRVSLYFKSKK